MMYNNDQYEAERETDARSMLIDLCGGAKATWVELTDRDGKKTVRILPRYLAYALMGNLAAGCDPSIASAKIYEEK